MEHNIFYAFVSVFIVSAISLIGLATLSLGEKILRRIIFLLVALAIGALLGDAFIHIIPEAFEKMHNSLSTSLLIIAGMITFFIFEKLLTWHHHHHETDDYIIPTSSNEKLIVLEGERRIKPLGKLILFSDGLHNLIDGIIIGTSYLVSIELGIASTIAVILHEIPQEIGDFGILLYAGYSKTKALWFNFLSALSAVAGVLAVLFLGQYIDSLIIWILPLAAGNFIYIASSDLFPELHKEHDFGKSILEVCMIIAGISAMYFLTFFE